MRLSITSLLCGVIFMFPSWALGSDLPSWLLKAIKKDDPDSLAYSATSGGCPYSDKELADIVEGVLIRSRIKPTNNFLSDELYLNVYARCMDITSGDSKLGYVLDLEIEFGRFEPKPAITFEWDFGSLWVFPESGNSRDEVKTHVEDAVTAYILANFDLGGDE